MAKRGYHHGNLKQALIEAALSLIEEKGPTGFTLSEAAKTAGVTPAAVYRHFQGREDLIAEAARQGFEMFADLMQYAYDTGQPSALAASRPASLSSQANTSAPPVRNARAAASPDRPRPRTAVFWPEKP